MTNGHEGNDATSRTEADAPTAFLRLWLVLTLSYVVLKFLFDLLVQGWIDLDWVLTPWPLILPLGQAAVFWVVSRRWRVTRG